MVSESNFREMSESMFFSNKDLKKLIIPLIIEQLLVVSVGMIDTVMVSSVGEAAVSGVSLVDTINILLINVFAALTTGGAVVAGHYLGQRDNKNASKAAWQLMLFSGALSILVIILFLTFHNFILNTVFGSITPAVMENAKKYLVITAFSIFPLAIYDGCAALFRAMGNSRVTMWISFAMNLLHVAINAVLIYGFQMGVTGAALSTTISRIFAAVVVFILMYQCKGAISFKGNIIWKPIWNMIGKILYIGVPNGLENSMFQLGKILLLSLVSTFGTYAITANAVSNTLATMNILPGIAMSYAQLSIVSYCIGAGDVKQAKTYTKKLMALAIGATAVISVILLLFTDSILQIFQLSPVTLQTAAKVIRYHAVLAVIFWVPSFCLPNSLRAAGDVMFTMVTAIASMWIFRIASAYAINHFFHLGLLGIWIAMTIDWAFRAIMFTIRYTSGKWLSKREKISN